MLPASGFLVIAMYTDNPGVSFPCEKFRSGANEQTGMVDALPYRVAHR